MPSDAIPLSSRPGRALSTTLAVAAALALAFAVALLAFRGHGRAPVAIVQHIVEVKAKAAATMASPKLIVLSASGGLFGIRARQLGERVGMPAVNFGLHGGLGINYIMYFGLEAARPGDVVLIAAEYPLFFSPWLISEDAAQLSWARGDDYLGYLDWSDRLLYLRSLSAEFLGRLAYNAAVPPAMENWFWRLDMISDVGDMNAGMPDERVVAERARNYEGDARSFATRPKPFPLETDAPPARALVRGIQALKERGVRIIATWPGNTAAPLYEESYRAMRENLPAFYAANGVEFIAAPDRGILSEDELFDTGYHTNDAGAVRRTKVIADAICAQTDICRPAR